MFSSVDNILKHCAAKAKDSQGDILSKYKLIKDCAWKEAEAEDLNVLEEWELEARLDDIEAKTMHVLDVTDPKLAGTARVERMRRKNPELGAVYDGTLDTIDKYNKGDLEGAAMAASVTAIRSTKYGQAAESIKDAIEDPTSILSGKRGKKKTGKPNKGRDSQKEKVAVKEDEKKKCTKKEKKAREKIAKKRPSRYNKGVVEKVWEEAQGLDGKVYDPNYPEIELTWDRTRNRNGQWDMGHRKGKSYDDLKKAYLNCKITRKQMLKEYNDPDNYYPENGSKNRSNKNTN